MKHTHPIVTIHPGRRS